MPDEASQLRVACSCCEATFFSRLFVGVIAPGIQVTDNFEECPHCGFVNLLPNGDLAELKANEPQEAKPREIRYTECNPFAGAPDHKLLSGLKTRELRPPVLAYLGNLTRLASVLQMPARLVWLSRLFEGLLKQAIISVTGDITKSPTSDDERRLVNERHAKAIQDWFSTTTPEYRATMFVDAGIGGLKYIVEGDSPLRLGLESVLLGQVTGMWTAFETLAGDLWEAALNAHPHKLSDLKGKRKIEREEPDLPPDLPEPEEPDPRYLRVSSLQRFGYDLSKHMGTALRHRYNFTVLERLREAYWEAFRKDAKEVVGTIEDRSIDALCAVRNAVVHKGGVADDKFMKDVSGNPLFPSLKENHRIPFDGPLIEALVAPVVRICEALIVAVDKWIVGNTTKPRKPSK